MTTTSFVVGLLGDNIGGSLAKPLQEGEGEAQGLSLAYRLLDATHTGLGLDDTADVLRLGGAAGVRRAGGHAPVQERDDGATSTRPARRRRPGRDRTSSSSGTAERRPQHRLGRASPRRCGRRCPRRSATGWSSSAPVAQGWRSGTARCATAPRTSTSSTRTATGPPRVAARLGALVGADRVSSTTDLAAALRDAGGLIQATPVGMDAHPGLPLDPALLRPDQWVADIIYFPLETELVRPRPRRRLSGDDRWGHGGAPARRRPSGSSPGGTPTSGGCRSTSSRSPDSTWPSATARARDAVRKSIATVSVSGTLEDKLEAIAAAALRGDRAVRRRPDRVGRCEPRTSPRAAADLGLAIDLFQPLRDVVGVSPALFPDRLAVRRGEVRGDGAARRHPDAALLGRPPGGESGPRPGRRAAGDRGPARRRPRVHAGVRGARVGDAASTGSARPGRSSSSAGMPEVGLAVDTFHLLARGDDATALAGIPGDRIGVPPGRRRAVQGDGRARVEPAPPVLPRPGIARRGRGSSRRWSRRDTAGRCPWRCSTTSSGRPSRTRPRATRCGRCCSSRSSCAGTGTATVRATRPRHPVREPGRWWSCSTHPSSRRARRLRSSRSPRTRGRARYRTCWCRWAFSRSPVRMTRCGRSAMVGPAWSSTAARTSRFVGRQRSPSVGDRSGNRGRRPDTVDGAGGGAELGAGRPPRRCAGVHGDQPDGGHGAGRPRQTRIARREPTAGWGSTTSARPWTWTAPTPRSRSTGPSSGCAPVRSRSSSTRRGACAAGCCCLARTACGSSTTSSCGPAAPRPGSTRWRSRAPTWWTGSRVCVRPVRRC